MFNKTILSNAIIGSVYLDMLKSAYKSIIFEMIKAYTFMT